MPDISTEWGNSSTELDFEQHWSAINVQDEVLRGIELREQKPKTNETEYVYVKIPLPSCSKCPDEASPRRRKTRRITKKTRLKHVNKDRSCPLRVVELAEPSKRHCLNTWKNKGHTLPNYMVDRLRKHVMDETPVVRISEAVNYFKTRKKSSKKSSPVRFKSRPEKVRRDFNMTLSSLFAYKVAQKLSKPINIVLNNELQNINQVIIYELNKILRNKKKNCINPYKSDKILNEMAQKVTIWIANILDETSYKQLLEELEDMEEEVGPVFDILDEIIESVLVTCKVTDSSSSVLSAENGSIGTLLSTKETEDGNESIYEDILEETNNFKGSEHTLNKDKIGSEKVYYDDELRSIYEKNTAKNQVQSLLEEKINDIVNNINNIEETNNNGEQTDLSDESNTKNDVTSFNQAMDNNNYLSSNKDQDYVVAEDNITPEPDKTNEFISKQSESAPVEDIYEPKNDTKLDSDGVADGFNLSIEDPDEETKKVKFSHIDMVNGEDVKQTNKHIFELTVDYKQLVVWKSSKDYILSHFNVAPPNPELLSYIDEVWPEYTLPPLLKATESVSKSVLSLGRIMEADENIVQSPNIKLRTENTENEFNRQLNKAMINLTGEGVIHENILNNNNNNKDVEKSDNINNNDNNLVKYIQGDNNRFPLEQLCDNIKMDDDTTKMHKIKDFPGSNTIDSNEKAAKDKQTKYCLNVEKPEIVTLQGFPAWKKPASKERGDVMSMKSDISLNQKRLPINACVKTTNGTFKIPVNNTYNKMKINKKIQTSFESNLVNDDFCFDRSSVQKWCMGLLNVTENLDLWTAWIQNVCLNIAYLKTEGQTLNKDALKTKHIKKWVDLKNNIDVDVQRWSQLGRRLCRGLKNYKYCYQRTRKATYTQPNKIKCNKCNNKSSQKNPLCSQNMYM